MSKYIGAAGQKLFANHMEKYSPADPLYEQYTDDHGNQKRRKRDVPPGLSKRDIAILKSVNKRAHYLDKGFVIPCCVMNLRFGWTFFIGLIPVVGDIADALLNYLLVVRKAKQAEIPPWLLSRMLLNNAVSIGVGMVPVAGDVVLAMWKANSRNAALLEEFLRVRGDEALKIQQQQSHAGPSSGEIVPGVTKSDAKQVKPGAGLSAGETPAVPGATKPTRSRFSWGKKKATPAGERGRFVENVNGNEPPVPKITK